jgi:3-mercaptopyruvate sulfurtransferase SseA
MDRGFEKVRPLEGGLDAWLAAGFEVDETAPKGARKPRDTATAAQRDKSRKKRSN